jgi:ParB family transcriptional regulator, chromosome partitioning protein
MARNLKNVRPQDCDNPSQPRSKLDLEYCRGLGENMKAIGQQVPIIGHTDATTSRFIVGDGSCRVQGAILSGIPELLALDLGKAPTPLELALAQAGIDIHKQHFPAVDRARLWQSIKDMRGCTAKQLAKELGVSDSLVGDYLSLLTLPPDVQELVNSGALHLSKASLIAQQESAPDQQRELAAMAKEMSRKELTARVKQARRNEQQAAVVRVGSMRCPLPSGTTVVVKGSELTLEDAIQALTELLKAMKKASEDGIDGSTFSRICRDKAKAG